jgi:tetratricopeptide (TPR) repeat protein
MGAETVLANAAFGDNPGRWPLPAAATPHQLWLRAVVAGGQGRYASALADLAGVVQRGGPLVSLAHSTRASFLRQLGWHARARTWDGRALALADCDPEAGADALIGLSADALGVGRFAASATALDRAADILTVSAPPRLPVRLAWVSAELAMARGDGAAAVEHAQRAVELAAALGSARHALKSDVILAAALCSAGELELSRRVADPALETSQRLGMVPLRWALASLLADIGSARCSAAEVVAIRDEAADTVRRRGGVWWVR